MPGRREPPSGWVPDARTINWAFGRAREDRVKDAVRLDVRDRGRHLDPDSDAYWTLVAEAAIEAILHDLADRAKEDGTVFSRESCTVGDDS